MSCKIPQSIRYNPTPTLNNFGKIRTNKPIKIARAAPIDTLNKTTILFRFFLLGVSDTLEFLYF